MKRILYITISLSLLAASCQKHLDRNEAKVQIANHDGVIYYPQKHTYEITKNYIKDMQTEGLGATAVIGEDEFEPIQKNIERFAQLGLIKLTETPQREETTAFLFGTTVRTWTSVKVELTEEGKKYLELNKENNFEIKLWDTDIKEITGIKEIKELKTAEVEYTIYNTNITPFGEIFSEKNRIQNRNATFSLYDDGWRIQ